MTTSKKPSSELTDWLERRENAFKLRAVLRISGGHVMLNSLAVDPNALEGPLREEVIEYLQNSDS